VRVIIISGIPGAGKTTVARMLAARFDRAAHIEGDLMGHHFIVSGLVPPQGPPQDEAHAQLELRRTNICLLADSFAAGGFQARDRDRDKQVFSIRSHLDTRLRTSMPRKGLWIDTPDLTEEQTVDAIAARLDEAVIPG
jgi:hypothetical protein